VADEGVAADETFADEDTLTIEARFCGPPDRGNGGYVAGLVAVRLGVSAAAEVRARATWFTLARERPPEPSIGRAAADGGDSSRGDEAADPVRIRRR